MNRRLLARPGARTLDDDVPPSDGGLNPIKTGWRRHPLAAP